LQILISHAADEAAAVADNCPRFVRAEVPACVQPKYLHYSVSYCRLWPTFSLNAIHPVYIHLHIALRTLGEVDSKPFTAPIINAHVHSSESNIIRHNINHRGMGLNGFSASSGGIRRAREIRNCTVADFSLSVECNPYHVQG
jgi:hypothetical protein